MKKKKLLSYGYWQDMNVYKNETVFSCNLFDKTLNISHYKCRNIEQPVVEDYYCYVITQFALWNFHVISNFFHNKWFFEKIMGKISE